MVWRVFHVTFLKSESKSHPSEKLCGSLTVHLSSVTDSQPALTLGLAGNSTSLDFEASPLLPWPVYSWAEQLQKLKHHIVTWICVKMPFMPPNWIIIHMQIPAQTASSMAFQLDFHMVTDRTQMSQGGPFSQSHRLTPL